MSGALAAVESKKCARLRESIAEGSWMDHTLAHHTLPKKHQIFAEAASFEGQVAARDDVPCLSFFLFSFSLMESFPGTHGHTTKRTKFYVLPFV